MLSILESGKHAILANSKNDFKDNKTGQHTEVVKPSSKLNLPTPNPIPLNVMDLIMPPLYLRFLMMYKLQPDSSADADGEKMFKEIVERLKTSLADALELYPPVAGRLRPVEPGSSELAIFCDGHGSEFMVESANYPFVDADVPDMQSGMLSSIPLLLPPDEVATRGSLFVKVTKFSCGTVTIVPALHHYVTDLASYMDFLTTWTKLARGESVDPNSLPKSWEREPMDFFSTNKDPIVLPESVPGIFVIPEDAPPRPFPSIRSTLRWYFSDASLEQLKRDCTGLIASSDPNAGGDKLWISTADAFTALVWAAQTRARYAFDPKVVANEMQSLGVAVDARERLKTLGHPHQYFGNFNLSLAVSAPREELLKPTLDATARVASTIRMGLLEHLTFEAMKKRVAFLEAQAAALRPRVGHRLMLEGDCRSTNWSRHDMTKMDFGAGLKPVYTNVGTRGNFPAGTMFIWRAEGGVIVATPLDSKEADDVLIADELMQKYGTLVVQ
ncbi:hypothetical protein K435DRAFT_835404 [Dendrothele bispora CBS 962.96]|uniref:Transferase n=1 Tax=Dendrothele bispora (strain CBS 962.96) TaxID=1314807 RepID=A0A4S8MNE5_DENBC|nr:hypothetical protein K435DRAFT_835404 [Dendrothele bispora CBS 962.96]